MKRLLRFRFSDLPPLWYGWLMVGGVVVVLVVIALIYIGAGCLDTHCQ